MFIVSGLAVIVVVVSIVVEQHSRPYIGLTCWKAGFPCQNHYRRSNNRKQGSKQNNQKPINIQWTCVLHGDGLCCESVRFESFVSKWRNWRFLTGHQIGSQLFCSIIHHMATVTSSVVRALVNISSDIFRKFLEPAAFHYKRSLKARAFYTAKTIWVMYLPINLTLLQEAGCWRWKQHNHRWDEEGSFPRGRARSIPCIVVFLPSTHM